MVAAGTEAREAIAEVNAIRWINIRTETVESSPQARRGLAGPDTAYRRIVTTRRPNRFTVDENHMAPEATDGMWPLITNDRATPAAELFDVYWWQPNLEERHA